MSTLISDSEIKLDKPARGAPGAAEAPAVGARAGWDEMSSFGSLSELIVDTNGVGRPIRTPMSTLVSLCEIKLDKPARGAPGAAG
jgi:hypothetical protein